MKFTEDSISLQGKIVKAKSKKTKFSSSSKEFIFKLIENMKKSMMNYNKNNEYIYQNIPLQKTNMVPNFLKSDIINKYVHKYSITLKVGIRLFNIDLYFDKKQTNEKLHEIFKYIYYALNTLNNFANTRNSLKVDITIIFTKEKKKYPKNKDILDIINVNSAFTQHCSSETEICIFRKEEWFKVFIHELIHNIGIDFACYDTRSADSLMFDTFNIKKNDIRLFEAYTESFATIINCLFISVLNTKDKSNNELILTKFNKLLNNEIKYSLIQCVNVLKHNGLKYENITNNDSESIAKRQNYIEKTHIFSYYVIKCILLFHCNEFIEWCNINNRTILFSQNENTIISFCNFISSIYNNNELLENIKSIEKENIKLNTLRMTVYEFEN